MKKGKGGGARSVYALYCCKRSCLVSHNLAHGMCMCTRMKYAQDMASLSAHNIQEYVTKATVNV